MSCGFFQSRADQGFGEGFSGGAGEEESRPTM